MSAFQINFRARKAILRALIDRQAALHSFAEDAEAMFGRGTAYDEMRAEARYIGTLADEFRRDDDGDERVL